MKLLQHIQFHNPEESRVCFFGGKENAFQCSSTIYFNDNKQEMVVAGILCWPGLSVAPNDNSKPILIK